jgi:hypothetical protein
VKRVWLALLLAGACERAEPRTVHEAPPPAKPRPPPAAHTLRVIQSAGDTKLAPDAPLPPGPLALAEGAVLAVAIDDGVRVELRGPGHYQLSADQLLASDGLATVDVAAQAQRAGQRAFAVATPAGQLSIPFAARLVFRAPARGASELALISGEAVAEGGLPVGASARVCFAAAGPLVLQLPGFATVEAALEALPASDACAVEPPPDLGKLDQELAQQLDSFERGKSEQEQLITRCAEQRQPGERGPCLVHQLAARGQQTLAARTRGLALRAQLAAAQLGVTGDPARAALLARARELEDPAH